MKSRVYVWAVDVSAWNREPYTRVDAKTAPRPSVPQFDRDTCTMIEAYDASLALKVQRYMRAIDRVRSLVGCLLPRVMLVDTDMVRSWNDVCIRTARGGRPYVERSSSRAHVDFNISHDGDWVVMAFSTCDKVGVDVMETTLPHFEESSTSFCDTMKQAMTADEYAWVRQGASDAEVLSRLYDVWTYKEALTKNMGLGLGFDFARIQVEFWRSKEMPSLRMDDHEESQYRFLEVRLPSGICYQDTSPATNLPPNGARQTFTTTCKNKDAVGGKGSQVAIAVGPRAWTEQDAAWSCCVSAEQASADGWLRIWTYEAFMEFARRVHEMTS